MSARKKSAKSGLLELFSVRILAQKCGSLPTTIDPKDELGVSKGGQIAVIPDFGLVLAFAQSALSCPQKF
jgi:hypothetical protein